MPIHKSKRCASAEGIDRGSIGQRKSARLAGRVSKLEDLPTDVLTKILSCLRWKEIMKVRVSKRIRQVSLITPVVEQIWIRRQVQGKWRPKSAVTQRLDRLGSVLPMVHHLYIEPDHSHPFQEEDEFTREMNAFCGKPWYMKVNMKHLRRFQHIKHLNLSYQKDHLRGHAPSEIIFSLSTLEELDIMGNKEIEFDLSDVSRLTRLKLFNCRGCDKATGSLTSLRCFQHQLESLSISYCTQISGDLARNLFDFTKLEKLLVLGCEGITGDIRDIRNDHFLAMKNFGIAGSAIFGNEIDFVSDTLTVMSAWRQLLDYGAQSRSFGTKNSPWGLTIRLSPDSPERFRAYPYYVISPPFTAILFKMGQRAGFVWANKSTIEEASGITKVTWLDPEPHLEDPDYTAYAEELSLLNSLLASKSSTNAFREMTRPPTEEEYDVLFEQNANNRAFFESTLPKPPNPFSGFEGLPLS